MIKEIKKELNYNINIMNHKGVIVASSDSERVNQIHLEALKVIKSKRSRIINLKDLNHSDEIKEGINLPIFFQNKCVGVVGVTGDPSEVNQLAHVLKLTVESLLTQKQLSNQLKFKQKAMNDWIIELTQTTDEHNTSLTKKAKNINLDTKKTCFIALLKIEDTPMSNTLSQYNQLEEVMEFVNFYIKTYFISQIDNNKLILGIQADDRSIAQCEEKLKEFRAYLFLQLNITSYIGIGGGYKEVKGYRQSYFEALHSVNLLEKIKPFEKVRRIEEWGLFRLLDSIPQSIRSIYLNQNRFINQIDDYLIITLNTFLNENLNANPTADKLHIHRNTLFYRLNKIHEYTGLNPRIFTDAMTLKILIDLKKIQNISY